MTAHARRFRPYEPRPRCWGGHHVPVTAAHVVFFKSGRASARCFACRDVLTGFAHASASCPLPRTLNS